MMLEALMRTGVNIVASRGPRVRPTDGEVRKRFVYGEHIARCTVRWAVWGLKIVVRDKVVFGVQALEAAMREMSIVPRERHQTLNSHRPFVLCDHVMTPLIFLPIRSREFSEKGPAQSP
jgi:hypothetical protein